MSPRLDDALRAVSSRLGAEQADRSVVRVDVRRDGALDLCLEHAGALHWFRFTGDGLVRCEPGRDDALALSGELDRRHEEGWNVLAYRPGRRLVVDLPGSAGRLVAKGYRKRRAQAAAQSHAIAARINKGSAFRVPRLMQDDSFPDTLIFERFPGRELGLGKEDKSRFFAIGVALRRLQEAGCDECLESFTADDELAVLERWERAHEAALGGPPREWCDNRERASALRSELPEPIHSLCHRDLHDGQLLVSEGGVALLDFDLLCCADVALDPANLLAHLSLRAMQGLRGATEQSVLACSELFMDGLGHQADEGFWTRLRFYESTSFLRLALIYALRPRWRHLQGQLIEMARLCLVELEHAGGD